METQLPLRKQTINYYDIERINACSSSDMFKRTFLNNTYYPCRITYSEFEGALKYKKNVNYSCTPYGIAASDSYSCSWKKAIVHSDSPQGKPGYPCNKEIDGQSAPHWKCSCTKRTEPGKTDTLPLDMESNYYNYCIKNNTIKFNLNFISIN